MRDYIYSEIDRSVRDAHDQLVAEQREILDLLIYLYGMDYHVAEIVSLQHRLGGDMLTVLRTEKENSE